MSRAKDPLYWLRGHKPSEDDWLHCQDRFFQQAMFQHVCDLKLPRKAAGRRKLRLIAANHCRLPQVWPMINQAHRRALKPIEEAAELGKAPELELPTINSPRYTIAAANRAIHEAARANVVNALNRTFVAIYDAWCRNDDTPGASDCPRAAELDRIQRACFRETFGNPFRETSIEQPWLTWRQGTVPSLARAAYEKRQLPSGHLEATRLAIVADALEEAGCANDELLGHLRSPGPHVRGCWVVDLLLNKA